MKNTRISNFLFLSNRLNKTGTSGREAIINLLSMLGISFGVVALIVILSVMNGFQGGYIRTIMEVSSAHIRLSGTYEQVKKIQTEPAIKSFFIFTESQALMQGNYNRQAGSLVRAVELEQFYADDGLISSLSFSDGSLDLEHLNTIVLGSELARSLAVNVGDEVFLPIIAGSKDVDMFSENARLLVTGIFKTGFLSVDSTYSFISYQTGLEIFGEQDTVKAFVKLSSENADRAFIAKVENAHSDVGAESWRTYNHAFFGALKVEKNVLMILVILIFLVVSVNIYNGMRRSIYERREDIAVLSSLGTNKKTLRFLFFLNGFKIGLIGSILGIAIGLLLSKNINEVFSIVEIIINFCIEVVARILYSSNTQNAFAIFSSRVFYMDTVPTSISFFECCYIAFFGLISSSCAALFATKKILKMKPQEILRYE